jgi:hypothetical protein
LDSLDLRSEEFWRLAARRCLDPFSVPPAGGRPCSSLLLPSAWSCLPFAAVGPSLTSRAFAVPSFRGLLLMLDLCMNS